MVTKENYRSKVNQKLHAMQLPNRFPSHLKSNSRQLGKKAEDLAINYLQNEGYKVLLRNYRYQKAEIDIIAQQDNRLCFVEVKARTNLQFGYPETFVTSYQQRLIKKAAENYMQACNWQDAIRFDIISIVQQGSSPELVHFKDAFI
jgi:putative endonuclease